MPSSVFINGITLVEPLEITHHREVMTSPDGMDYLCTANTVHAAGTYNPATNAYILQGGANNPKPGTLPANTLTNIRHQLEQVRGTVKVTLDGVDIIKQSPPDVRNGPFVRVHDIQECMGQTTFMVAVSFVTYMNERALYTKSNAPVLLSHRWYSEDSYDPEYYLTRTIHGHAEFRGDVLANRKVIADQFRAYLWHPTPAGFKLDACNVRADSNGLWLDYQLVFRQKPIIVVAPGVVRIEAYDALVLHQGNAENFRLAQARAVLSLDLEGTVHNTMETIPGLVRRIAVKVWGYPQTPRIKLLGVAFTIAQNRMGKLSLTNLNVQTINQDLMGRFVEVVLERNMGGLNKVGWENFAGVLFGTGQTEFEKEIQETLKIFQATDDTAYFGKNIAVDVFNGTDEEKKRSGPYLQGDTIKSRDRSEGEGCRGTFLANLAVSALLGSTDVPPSPRLPTNLGSVGVS